MQDIATYYQNIVNVIETIFDADSISVLTHLNPKENIYLSFSKIRGNRDMIANSVHMKKSLVGEILQGRTSILSGNLAHDPNYSPDIDSLEGEQPASMICTAIRINERVRGAIICRKNAVEGFNEKDLVMLESLTGLTANFLDTIEEVKQLTISNAELVSNRWKVQRSRDTLRTLFDNLPFAMYIINRDWEMVAVNKWLSNQLNVHPNQLVGQKCYQVRFGRTSPCVNCQAAEAFLSGSAQTWNYQHFIEQKGYSEFEMSQYAIKNERAAVQQLIVVEEDITEKRQMENHLRQSEKLAAIGQLVAGLAHEINNPMAAIIANAQILKEDMPPDEDLMEAVDLIIMAGERANQVLHNLLDLSRQENLKFVPSNLNESIKKAVAMVNYQSLVRSVNVTMDLDEDIPEIMADQEDLQGVWINLMLNAFDSIENAEGKVTVSTARDGNKITVSVEDNGSGIPPELQEHIFEPFFTTKGPEDGTGLGLSLVHRTVKRHGGLIEVKSQVGRGTRFILTFPIEV